MDKLDTMVEKKVLPLQQLQIDSLKLTQEFDAFVTPPTLFRLGSVGETRDIVNFANKGNMIF